MMESNDQEGDTSVEVTPPAPLHGLRRSRRLQNLPPSAPPPPASREGGHTAATAPPQEEETWEVKQRKMKLEELAIVQKEEELLKLDVEGLQKKVGLQYIPPPPPLAEGDRTTAVGGEGYGLVGDDDVNVGGSLAEGGGPSASPSSHDMGTVAVESPENALEVEEVKAHPCLLNEDILDMVFKRIVNQSGPSCFQCFVLKDIQNCRLICKLWRNSMTRVYRQIRPALELAEEYNNWLGAGPPPITGFVDTMRASDMIPVQKYILEDSVFSNCQAKVMEDFLRICGPGLVSLDMTISPNDARKITKHLQNALPPGWGMMKMKRLGFHISSPPVEGHIRQEMGIVDMAGLLLDAGKTLREFELSTNSKFTDPLITLEEHLASRIPKTVKKIILKMHVAGLVFNNLAESGLTLESFEFRVPSLLESGSGSLFKFLESQAVTLKWLRVEYLAWMEEGIPVRFPRLGELLHLELSDETDFVKSFPKLHRFKFDRIHADDAPVSLLSSTYNKPFWTHLQKFAQCFPSLAELHIRLHNEVEKTLTEIFKYFVNIECLDICFADSGPEVEVDLDSIFCGDHGGSLLNLTKLKKLVVRNDRYSNTELSLTDDSAECVFLEMNELRELHLPRGCWAYPSTRFSPENEVLLREKLAVLRIGDSN